MLALLMQWRKYAQSDADHGRFGGENFPRSLVGLLTIAVYLVLVPLMVFSC